MATYGFLTLMDRSGEKATFSFFLPPLAADGANYATITAAFDAVKAAVEDVTGGVVMESSIVAKRTRHANAIPADGRREQKWLGRYQDDSTFKVYNWEVPCNDIDTLPMKEGTDFVDMNYAVAGTLKDNLDAFVAALNALRSPTNGTVTVISIQDVGRNT
jgi:hypothetical protein